ncbi:MAG: hypothetical protein ACE366_07445 [Bradymonadia bacterium]
MTDHQHEQPLSSEARKSWPAAEPPAGFADRMASAWLDEQAITQSPAAVTMPATRRWRFWMFGGLAAVTALILLWVNPFAPRTVQVNEPGTVEAPIAPQPGPLTTHHIEQQKPASETPEPEPRERKIAVQVEALLEQLKIVNERIGATEIRLGSVYSEFNAVLAEPHTPMTSRLEPLMLELADARTNLRNLSKQYTSSHPDVVAARSKVKVIMRKIEIFENTYDPQHIVKRRYDPRTSPLRSKIAAERGALKRLKRRRAALERKLKAVEASLP